MGNIVTHTLAVSEDGIFIIQTIVGDLTRDSAIRNNIEAHALGKQLGINRYLSDLTSCRNVESPVDDYAFATADMENDAINHLARVALLVSPDDHSHDFIETVLKNAGQNVTIFRDREAAEAFLRK